MTPKFRVWHKDGKVMLSNYLGFMITVAGQLLIESILGDETTMEKVEPDNYIVMQYTGLKDKHGVEIYEGDIVEYFRKYKSIIEWRDGGFIIRREVDGAYELMQDRLAEMEVIGNIHENPELLKEQNK